MVNLKYIEYVKTTNYGVIHVYCNDNYDIICFEYNNMLEILSVATEKRVYYSDRFMVVKQAINLLKNELGLYNNIYFNFNEDVKKSFLEKYKGGENNEIK